MSTKPARSTSVQEVKAFADHIGELRLRVTWVILAFLITSALAYQFRDVLVNIVLAPIGHQKLVYLTPAGGFSFIFQVTMYAGAVVAAPVLIYQLYQFVRPALPKRATRYSFRIIVAATLLMVAGVCFGYFVAVPAALHFLTAFAGPYIEANLTADSYLNFVLAYVAGLGLMFQLPLLLIFWNWISPLSGKKLLATERFVVLFAFIAAALITPTPDPTNQAMIAVPIILIYQAGVVAVLAINRHPHRTSELVAGSAPMGAGSVAVSLLPQLPEFEPIPIEQPEPDVMPKTQIKVQVQRPAPRPKRPVLTIDGIRPMQPHGRGLQPIQRAEARLISPQRSAAQINRRGSVIDDVSRVYSA